MKWGSFRSPDPFVLAGTWLGVPCFWGKAGVQDSAAPALLASHSLFEAVAGVKSRRGCVCWGARAGIPHV